MDWDDLRIALAVARFGTHAAAGDALKINAATVGRRLARMEQDLGSAIFERDQGHWVTTQFGEQVLAQAERMDDLADTIRHISQSEAKPKGTVRITATESLTTHILIPQLARLYKDAPQLLVELVPSVSSLNLTKREADIAIRLERPKDTGTVIRKVADIGFAIYVLREKQAQASRLPWVEYDDTLADKVEAQWSRLCRGRNSVVLRTSDVAGLQQAIACGFGVGVLPCFIGDADQRLIRVHAAVPAPTRSVWLMMPESLQTKLRVRTAADWVAAVFKGLQPELRG